MDSIFRRKWGQSAHVIRPRFLCHFGRQKVVGAVPSPALARHLSPFCQCCYSWSRKFHFYNFYPFLSLLIFLILVHFWPHHLYRNNMQMTCTDMSCLLNTFKGCDYFDARELFLHNRSKWRRTAFLAMRQVSTFIFLKEKNVTIFQCCKISIGLTLLSVGN